LTASAKVVTFCPSLQHKLGSPQLDKQSLAEVFTMSLGLILIIILILMLLGVIPRWPHSRNWGYGPSGGVGLLLVIIIILLLLRVI
jgi:hypothetical protein